MGIADLGGKTVRVSSFNVNLEQNVLFYDHTIGLRDSIGTTLLTTKGDAIDGGTNPQKSIYRPSVIGVNGSVAFPLQDGEESALFDEAKTGKNFDVKYLYACDGSPGLTFSSCKVNSYTLNLSAGDICTANASIIGINASETGGSGFTTSKKLITWDAAKVTGISGDIMSFTMTINNNCSYVYTAGENKTRNLRPALIRVGIQSVTGNVVVYGTGMSLGNAITVSSEKTLDVKVGGLSFKLNCVFLPIKREGSPSVFVTSIPFVGIGSYWS